MNNKLKNILIKFSENNYEAYIVGGYIRDYLLGIESFDIDIATSATPKEIKELFDLNNSNEENYGHIMFKDSLYNYDITTFRKELKYENRKPVEFAYITDYLDDIKRRDFTINALLMDENGVIHDHIEGKKDLEDKIIRVIGNIDSKMCDDPLRLMRAIRFASALNFKIEDNLYNYIRQNKQLIRTLSYTRKKEELDKIFKSTYKLYGLQLIKDLNLEDVLEINIPDDIKYTEDFLGIWAQIDYSDSYQFKNSDIDKINGIKKVINYGIIDNIVLYECGLYVSIIAGEILGVPKYQISDIYKNMPIYSVKDLALNGNDIIDVLNIPPGDVISDIIFDLEINILNGTIENKYENLKEYIEKHWR